MSTKTTKAAAMKAAKQPEPTAVPEESTAEPQFGGLADQPVIEQRPYNSLMVFTSPVCGPCKSLKPLLEAINQETPFIHEVISFAPETEALFQELGVRNVPAMVHVNVSYDGKDLVRTPLARVIGFDGEAAVRAKLQQWGYLA